MTASGCTFAWQKFAALILGLGFTFWRPWVPVGWRERNVSFISAVRRESKNQGSCICCKENGWRLQKAITVRSKRVMVSNQETRKEFISEQ